MSPEALQVSVELAYPGFSISVDELVHLAGVTAVFGASGSGKTTLLRTIAGFESATGGRIAFGDDVWFDAAQGVNWPAWRRPVGFLFQDTRLFSHLTVLGNLEFAERRRKRARQHSIDEVVRAFSLDALLPRSVSRLSGGERQRVALARTLLTAPSIVLLDEPLAALDRQSKRDILPYLEDLPGRFKVPVLYVSHDVDEVSWFADRMLVLDGGRVIAHADAIEVLNSVDVAPLSEPVDLGATILGVIERHDDRLGLSMVRIGSTDLSFPLQRRLRIGQTIRLRVRARDVALATRPPEGLSIRNVLPARLLRMEAVTGAAYVDIHADIGGAVLRSRVTRAAVEELGLAEGMDVYALIKSASFDGLGASATTSQPAAM